MKNTMVTRAPCDDRDARTYYDKSSMPNGPKIALSLAVILPLTGCELDRWSNWPSDRPRYLDQQAIMDHDPKTLLIS